MPLGANCSKRQVSTRRLELLGTLVPDVGRLTNRMWCYFASDVRSERRAHQRESGVAVVQLPEREALKRATDGRWITL